MSTGVIGGAPAYLLLRRLGSHIAEQERSSEQAGKQGSSKLQALFGPRVWSRITGRTVIDFGCGGGFEAVEMAKRGAHRVIGVDCRQWVLDHATELAKAGSVSRVCNFCLHTEERADVIFSIDGFEHYDDPTEILKLFGRLLKPGGSVLISFGPPWLHPYGGHLFSVFPWAHLVFTENALIRWRSDFKSDGATRFREVDGGLNQMTVARFRRLISESDFAISQFEPVPIRRLRHLHNRFTEEFLTSVVKCVLVPKAAIS